MKRPSAILVVLLCLGTIMICVHYFILTKNFGMLQKEVKGLRESNAILQKIVKEKQQMDTTERVEIDKKLSLLREKEKYLTELDQKLSRKAELLKSKEQLLTIKEQKISQAEKDLKEALEAQQ